MSGAPPADAIYTMVRQSDWRDAERTGHYQGSADDKADGFLHFSTAGQLRASARRHRRGETDLLLVAADPAHLGPALKWEHAASRGEDFPHLYRPLSAREVLWVRPLPLGPDGEHIFPDAIPPD